METTYAFTAFNTETIYGYGTEMEAEVYLGWLNETREINQYEMEISNLTDEEAEDLAFNLSDEIADLFLIGEDDEID